MGYSTRMFQDIVRIGAYIGSLDNSYEISIDNCNEAMDRCFDNMIASYKFADLNKLGEFVRVNMKKFTVREMAEQMGTSPSTIERTKQHIEYIERVPSSSEISDSEMDSTIDEFFE